MLGSTISNLGSLVRVPTGCGEQNMIYFVPNIVVLQYMRSIDRLEPELEKRALENMRSGYQRELTYRHDDGSFSAFGKSDDRGSTWLTAFVTKSFHQALGELADDIDEGKLRESLAWLLTQQEPDGHFVERGRLVHKDMAGGGSSNTDGSTSGANVPLSAYVLVTLLENEDILHDAENEAADAIRRAVGFLEAKLDESIAQEVC